MAKTPLPVNVENEEPLQVEVAQPSPELTVTNPAGKISLAPTTTEQQDIVTAGQRHISAIWEYTQATIAILVVGATIFMTLSLALRTVEPSSNALLVASQLIVMATYIITTYFTRTNHVNIGGIGPKANELPYRGR